MKQSHRKHTTNIMRDLPVQRDRVKVIENPVLFRPGMIGTVEAINWDYRFIGR